jgi:hypothetical protein
MSDFAPKVALATLHKRTSQSGRTYFTGFMGKARVLLFEDAEAERPEWSDGVFTLFVQEQPAKDAKPAPTTPRTYREARGVDAETVAAYEKARQTKQEARHEAKRASDARSKAMASSPYAPPADMNDSLADWGTP